MGLSCFVRITQLLDQYATNALVIQDATRRGTPRAMWIANSSAAIAALAKDRDIPVFAYSRDQVRDAFGSCPNKQWLAELVAKHIPAFEQYAPTAPRKPWMSEDRRMGLFDAATLGLLFFRSLDN
ncbi:Holliday junction resolvasome RuvABC endonuclease subunit [Bradyrhizobium yuanmingense]|uniref:Holliday junction resolvasome RuvABC endonuclease subunit n=1 Tax=Bradyrhizobium yuanmingense TaxID=108015 RepID=A0ABV4GHQ9_9BRAD